MNALLPPAPDRRLGNRVLYAACRAVIVVVCKCLWSVRIEFRGPLPGAAPFILTPTHRSALDIPFMGFVTRRPIRFMGKVELWRKPMIGKFLTALGGFPVKRGAADRAALAEAIRVLELGAPLTVFPEGTRGLGGRVARIEEGVAYLAMKTGAPIVPIGVAGSEHILAKGKSLPRFTKVVIVVGEPIPVPRVRGRLDRLAMTELNERVMAELQSVFDQANQQLFAR
ncbi:MAG: lysophospholipid acyltransferase family protein [Acidimicrobiia bacterium]